MRIWRLTHLVEDAVLLAKTQKQHVYNRVVFCFVFFRNGKERKTENGTIGVCCVCSRHACVCLSLCVSSSPSIHAEKQKKRGCRCILCVYYFKFFFSSLFGRLRFSRGRRGARRWRREKNLLRWWQLFFFLTHLTTMRNWRRWFFHRVCFFCFVFGLSLSFVSLVCSFPRNVVTPIVSRRQQADS